MELQNSCCVRVGRLLEIDVAAGYRTVADVDEMCSMMRAALAGLPMTTRIVIAADWRACRVLSPAVAERVTGMLVGVNARIERSAIIHSPVQATSVMQVLRLVQDAQCADRRVFKSAHEMVQWLGEVLSPIERARLYTFIGQGPLAGAV